MSLKNTLLVIVCLFALPSCYEDVEGCLNVNATNYDLDADIACTDNCCTFPSLSLSVTHKYGEAPLRQDSFYVDAANHQFRINRLRYYWSDVKLITSNNDSIEPTEALSVDIIQASGETVTNSINDNLALVSSVNNNQYNLGNFQTPTTFSGLSFLLGIEDGYQRIAPASAPDNHPLNFQEDRLYYGVDTGYVQFKLEYDIVIGNDTTSKVIQAFDNQPLQINFVTPALISAGTNALISAEADISLLLQQLDLNANEESLANTLTQRFPAIFNLSLN